VVGVPLPVVLSLGENEPLLTVVVGDRVRWRNILQ
jgi:hypothetical protein